MNTHITRQTRVQSTRKEDVQFYEPKVRTLDKEGQAYDYSINESATHYKYEWDQIELEKIMQGYGN